MEKNTVSQGFILVLIVCEKSVEKTLGLMYQSYMAKKVRDNKYWLGRLEREHPKIYVRYMAGEIKSVRLARAAAGLINLPTRFDALKREWNGASHQERGQFIDWLVEVGFPVPGSMPPPMTDILDDEGYLKSEVAARLNAVIEKAGYMEGKTIHTGPLMKAMGFSTLNTSLVDALKREKKLSPKLVPGLVDWLEKTE